MGVTSPRQVVGWHQRDEADQEGSHHCSHWSTPEVARQTSYRQCVQSIQQLTAKEHGVDQIKATQAHQGRHEHMVAPMVREFTDWQIRGECDWNTTLLCCNADEQRVVERVDPGRKGQVAYLVQAHPEGEEDNQRAEQLWPGMGQCEWCLFSSTEIVPGSNECSGNQEDERPPEQWRGDSQPDSPGPLVEQSDDTEAQSDPDRGTGQEWEVWCGEQTLDEVAWCKQEQ